MKIAVIGVQKIPSRQGGIERYCQELYPKIVERGHHVDLFIRPEHHQQSWFSIYFYRQIRVITLAFVSNKRLNLLFNSALSTILATFGNYDVIHIQGVKAGWICWFPQLFSDSKIIVTSHELDCRYHLYPKSWRWLFSRIEKTAITNADEVIVLSKALGQYYQQKYQISPHHIPNGPGTYIEISNEFNYGKTLGLKQNKYLLCIGQLIPENQPDLLLEAFQKIPSNDHKLLIVGEIGSSVKYAIELLATAKQRQDIIFINKIRGGHLAEIIRGAALMVCPGTGLDLGQSMTILEAMREGIPVLASDHPVHRELLGKNRGLLFELGNLSSLVTKLEYALRELLVMQGMAQLAQSYTTIYHNWDRITYGNLFLYLKATSKTRITPVDYQAENS